MSVASTNKETNKGSIGLAARLAMRELRGGLRGFYVFLACLALGVAAISGVGSLSHALFEGLAAEGQAILGGDVEFSIIHRRADTKERAFLNGLGQVGELASLRAMARGNNLANQSLAEVKAVDSAYPLYGNYTLKNGGAFADGLALKDGRYGALVDAELLARLERKIGDTIWIGEAEFTVRDVVTREPDRLSAGLIFGPRIFMSTQALDATKLLRPGSLVRWRYRVRLGEGQRDDAALKRIETSAQEKFPDTGWRIRNRNRAAPRLANAIDRLTQILTLVGLTVLIVGGVGVANAVRAYLDTKRQVIATLKCLGAPGQTIFWIYLIQVAVLALAGIIIGLGVGAFLPPLVGLFVGDVLPINAEIGIYSGPLVLAIAYGMLTALAFSLWPLGRARDVPAAVLFREGISPGRAWPKPIYLAGVALSVGALAAIAILTASNQRLAIMYVVAAACAFVLLRFVAAGIMALAKRAPSLPYPEVRLAIGNIHRPGALTPSVVLSLGLGLTLLVALALIDRNLTHQLTSAIPDQAPSFFFVDIQRGEQERFAKVVHGVAEDGKLESVPMLRGRWVTLHGVPAQDIVVPPNKRWALRGDRGITYADTPPDGAKLTQGTWWKPGYFGPPLVSFESELAQAFGLNIGDEIVVNVLGRKISAKVANFRRVDWSSLGINFVMVFSANTFAGAPHMVLSTLTLPQAAGDGREIDILKAVSKSFPQVTIVRVKDALDAANKILSQVMWAIRGASSITVIASILVLAGALAAGQTGRIRDAVVLKTVGATRGRLIAAFGLEYLLLGLTTAIFAVLAGSVAAAFVLTQVMKSEFTFFPSVAIGTAAGAMVITIVLGLAGSWRTLGEKPSRVLREL